MHIRIGSRKSNLAIIQTNFVINKIKAHFPEAVCEIIPLITSGDKIQDKNLYDIGGKALFLKELEEHLFEKKIDMAVHSLKDVPGVLAEGFVIAAVTEREDPRDVFVSLKYKSINDIPIGGVIGSSSMRRKIYIQQKRPDIEIVQFRGNIQTRLKKLQDLHVDATILAAAGLHRAGLFDSQICHYLSPDDMLPAVGQGIIGIEILSNNKLMNEVCAKINHMPTWYLSEAERSFMTYLDASCRTPLASYATYENAGIKAQYMLSDYEGTSILTHTEFGQIEDANQMGITAAKILKKLVITERK